MVWAHVNVLWPSKDDSTGHSKEEKEEEVNRRRDGKTICCGQGRTLLAQLRQLKTGLGGKELS